MQKLIDTKVEDQNLIIYIIEIIKPNILSFMKNSNSSHIINKLISKPNAFYINDIINIILNNFEEIATDKEGCCIIQRTIEAVELEIKVNQHK